MQGEAVLETPPMRQNRCLVSERVIEPGAVPPHEHTPEAEGKKTPQNESIPTDDQEQPRIVAEDEICRTVHGDGGTLVPPHIDESCEVLTGSVKLKTGFVKSESEKFSVKKLLCLSRHTLRLFYHALDHFYTSFYAMPS